ncbi:MAG: methyl-accepting chemotaxis protein, partial [Oscillospiraceae bacterium]|nr:methyl-accepting chemotaxis protein [Oscillospiraceae bacterium]
IDKGTLLVEEVSGKLSGVATAANEVAVINEKIEESSKLSAESINQITVGVDQISTVVQTNSATSEETAAASEELSGQAQMLQEEIGRFNLKGGSTRRPAAAFRPEPVAPAQPSKPLVPPSASNITINLDDDKY